jgi:hypothetical protein
LWIPYVAGDVYYNRVNYKKSKTIGVNCEDGSCDYFRSVDYDMQYRERGISLKGGVLFRAHRFVLDFQVGLRGRFIDYNTINEPIDPRSDGNEGDDLVLFPFLDLLETKEKDRNTISPTVGIRIGYVIR